jgi:multiple sugar transport system substrate-binding protein
MPTRTELELSIMADSPAGIQPLLDEFELESGIRVRLRLLAWDTAWSDLVKVGLYGDGPDVSEIGSTWLGDLVAMNAIRALDEAELAHLERPSAFLPSAWQGGRLAGQSQTWAIPWLAGARLLFFRPALLATAGLEARPAFPTAAELDETLAHMQASGVPVPWTVPTGLTHTTLLNAASWVWAAGGDFITADGKRTLFSQPEARAGLRQYFALGRYLAPAVRRLTGLEPDQQFLADPGTAMTISGPWMFRALRERGLGESVSVALPPGATFVGGSHLVVWKHSRQPEAVLKLVRFLIADATQVAYSQRVGLLPTRLNALTAEPFASDPWWQLAIRGLKTGRSFPVTRSWGLMEDRLTRELKALWDEVLADPELDLDAAIARHLEPLALRLDLVLGH